MAIVRTYFHRTPARVAPHLRYIATREGASGLHGLGPHFRALRGDVEACVRLFQDHAAQARQRIGGATREGAFMRLLFTLPTATAARVSAADAHVPEGSRLVLRDALEATFRSVGRHLQGVYAVHFHAARREAHGHVHVDLSPLDVHGRPTFVTDDQRERFRTTWEREIAKALERVERRSPRSVRDVAQPVSDAHAHGARTPATSDSRASTSAETDATSTRTGPRPRRPVGLPDNPHAWTVSRVGRHLTTTQRTPAYMRLLAGRLLAATRNSQAPLLDLFLRAFITRADERWRKKPAPFGVRFALGFPIPHVLVRAHTPLATRTLRLPFTS